MCESFGQYSSPEIVSNSVMTSNVSAWKEKGYSFALDWSRDGNLAFGVYHQVSTAQVFRILKPKGVATASLTDIFRDLAFTEDFKSIISVGLIGICLWDLHSGELKRTVKCKGSSSVSTSSSSGIFATGGDDSMVHVWEEDFMLAHTVGENLSQGAAVRGLDIGRRGTKLVALHGISILDAQILDFQAIRSPDERKILSAEVGDSVFLWDARSPINRIKLLHGSFVSSVAYGFDNCWALSGGMNGHPWFTPVSAESRNFVIIEISIFLVS